jgi:hypothetical protein
MRDDALNAMTNQVMCWDRIRRPARNVPQARSLSKVIPQSFSRFALIAGGTPAVPANHLTGPGNHLITATQLQRQHRPR